MRICHLGLIKLLRQSYTENDYIYSYIYIDLLRVFAFTLESFFLLAENDFLFLNTGVKVSSIDEVLKDFGI